MFLFTKMCNNVNIASMINFICWFHILVLMKTILEKPTKNTIYEGILQRAYLNVVSVPYFLKRVVLHFLLHFYRERVHGASEWPNVLKNKTVIFVGFAIFKVLRRKSQYYSMTYNIVFFVLWSYNMFLIIICMLTPHHLSLNHHQF